MSDLIGSLQEFYREKLSSLLRHQEHARLVGQYDFNNTYQYIVNREETQLGWVASAIAEQGGAVPESAEPAPRTTAAKGADAARQVIEEDATGAQAFVDRWRPRADAFGNARHARMLHLILGEVLEQKRFFEQALAGRTDLLGRRAQQTGPAQGEVLPSRWIE